MSTPNMKTFCLATVKPYIKSISDNLETRISTIDINNDKIDSTADAVAVLQQDMQQTTSTVDEHTTTLTRIDSSLTEVIEDTQPIPNDRIVQMCQDAWTDH